MKSFKITLLDGTVISGLHTVHGPPAQWACPPKYRPLVVGLHGGSYSSSYFDATPTCTAQTLSSALDVPFVAIDRPGYGETTPVTPVPEGSDFSAEWGTLLHRVILPALWLEFGLPNGCKGIVLHCHSFGVTGAIVAAALHALDATQAAASPANYRLAGLVLSGFGTQLKPTGGHPTQPDPPPSHIRIPVAVKDSTLLLPGTAADEVYAQADRLDHPMPLPEIASLRHPWLDTWRERWGVHVTVPILLALAGRDHYWHATAEHLDEFAAAFPKSTRIDTSILAAAPHNIELSYWGPGWYAHSFGFAIECVTSLMLDN
ncbi:hypothetical protein CMQ_3973 [Grosmannia clavigera kw1407]|uniref:AB hydrolase-1 domain-containing protein n=1 Tax=Grosmannia clavigera (strain kw1407 / UAMH 11150) TaxID=655863 RepID=F0X838_GROCL|nr:uncharacterized protein CMQ_3973 [Grosmannia clavigera kw1407]EFX05904.1 hypothetical protein CMQ_3973 [Grosmannia clavigera kw1407]